MNYKLVSVIITTHNRPPSIVLRAIKSVQMQTYHNMELIVVDDSDPCYSQRLEVENTIRQASDTIKYIKHSECKGGCASRNTGLSYAKGYYIAFLDDDDEWLPTKIEEELSGFVDDSVALVYCGTIVVDEIKGRSYIRSTKFKRGYVFEDLLISSNFIGGTSNPLIRRECIDEAGQFDVMMQSLQDYDLWLRITMRYPVNYVNKPLIKYYIHNDEDRISTIIDKQIEGHKRINNKYEKFLTDKHKWFLRYRSMIPLYVEKGLTDKAFQIWLKCVQKSPFSVLKNSRQLLLILFGFDHAITRGYLWMQFFKKRILILMRE